jgi:hypothetical protein
LLALALASCTSWRTLAAGPGYRLHAEKDVAVDAEPWKEVLPVTVRAVEAQLGPFGRPVDVHVLSGGDDAARSGIETQPVLEAPGLGPARVRAYHTRGAPGPFGSRPGSAGIFAREPAPGVLVHELVHARVAESDPDLPRWLEEGVATLLADGARDGERWVVDGLAAWPLAELRGARPSDPELERLLALRRGTDLDARDELLVHFVGWAIVWDLARAAPELDARAWVERLRAEPREELRARLQRSTERGVELAHLEERLAAEDPALRRGAALGTWKLGSPEVLELLATALEREQDPETRATLAVNLLSTASVVRSRHGWRRAARAALPVLAEVELDDPDENAALRDLARATRRPWLRTRGDDAMERLERLWRE